MIDCDIGMVLFYIVEEVLVVGGVDFDDLLVDFD